MNANDTGAFSTVSRHSLPSDDREATLIRFVVIVAIAAIVASASYGSYQNYARRANRAAVQEFMLEVRDRQQLYLRDMRVYADELGQNGLGMELPGDVAQHYAITIAVTDGSSPGYVITATPGGNQSVDGILKLSSKGARWPIEKWRQ